MRCRPGPLAMLLALLVVSAFGGCTALPPVSVVSIAPPAEDPLPCVAAARARARVPALLAEGRLDRTVRVVQRADALCPKSAAQTWAPLVTALAQLGRGEEARSVAARIEASREADGAAREAAKRARGALQALEATRERPSGRALLHAGLEAKARGDRAGAQRLFDRAMVELSRAVGQKVVVAVPAALPGPVSGLSWSRDGRALAVATGSVVSIRDASARFRETMRLEGHSRAVNAVAFSPDGSVVASGSRDTSVRLWSLATGALTHTLDAHTHPVTSVAFSPDGKTLASGSQDETVQVWNVATGEVIRELTGLTRSVRSLAFSPDGKTLAAGSGEPMASLVVVTATPSRKPVYLRLWSVATGAVKRDLDGEGWSLAFSPDGRTLAAGEDEVRLWNLQAGSSIRAFSVPHKGIWDRTGCVAFSPDGKTLASGSDDKIVRLWSLASSTARTFVGHTGAITSVAFSPDGKALASGSSDGTVRFWNVATGAETGRLPGHLPQGYAAPIAFAPDGKTFTTGSADASLRLYPLGADASNAASRRLDMHAGPVGDVTYARDGRTLAARLGTTAVLVRNLVTGAETRIATGKNGSVSSIALSPDGATLATGSADRAAHLWNVASGAEIRKLAGHTRWVRTVAFSPDGATLATGSTDRSVRLWSVATGAQTKKLAAHTRDVKSLAFSPDGAQLASSSDDQSVSLWNVATGGEIRELQGHASYVNSVAWSPDGRTLATASTDATVRLWSAESGIEKQYLDTATRASFVAVSPGGRTVAASVEDAIHFWSVGGAPLLVLHTISDRNAGVGLTPDDAPLVELLGPDAKADDVYCRVGPFTFPFDLCRERFEVPGMLAQALAGDASYAEP